ncbi:hypothetical protein IAU59_003677 [Kwoniella sp. CBS 9459]
MPTETSAAPSALGSGTTASSPSSPTLSCPGRRVSFASEDTRRTGAMNVPFTREDHSNETSRTHFRLRSNRRQTDPSPESKGPVYYSFPSLPETTSGTGNDTKSVEGDQKDSATDLSKTDTNGSTATTNSVTSEKGSKSPTSRGRRSSAGSPLMSMWSWKK